MRRAPSTVRLVFLPFEWSSSRGTQPYPKDTCQDSECTETLVLDIVEIVTAATSAIANLKDILSFNLAKKIAEIAVVSPTSPPESDTINSQPIRW